MSIMSRVHRAGYVHTNGMSIMSHVDRAGYVHTNGMSIMSHVDRGYVHLLFFFVII